MNYDLLRILKFVNSSQIYSVRPELSLTGYCKKTFNRKDNDIHYIGDKFDDYFLHNHHNHLNFS